MCLYWLFRHTNVITPNKAVVISMAVTFRESEPFVSHLFKEGVGGGGRVLRMRLFPYRQAPLLNNCLPFEDTHPSVRENRTNMLATGKLRTYGRTGRRTDQNSVLQLPCQLQSSCLDSNPPTGNDSTPVLLLSLTILLMILTSPLPCVE